MHCKFCGYPTNGDNDFCSKECETDYKEREIIKRMGETM